MATPGRGQRLSSGRLLMVALVLGSGLGVVGCSPPVRLEEEPPVDQHQLDSRQTLLRVTSQGLAPLSLPFFQQNRDSLVIYNELPDRPVRIVFAQPGTSLLGCPNTRHFRTVGQYTEAWLEPGAAASLCLHDSGSLGFEVQGAGDQPWVGELLVERDPRFRWLDWPFKQAPEPPEQ